MQTKHTFSSLVQITQKTVSGMVNVAFYSLNKFFICLIYCLLIMFDGQSTEHDARRAVQTYKQLKSQIQ